MSYWVEPCEQQAGGFLQAGGDIEALQCVSGGPLSEVVQSADEHRPFAVGVDGEPEVTEVGPGQELGLGEPVDAGSGIHQPHERFRVVVLSVEIPESALSGATARSDVDDDLHS